jgi:hypothetical protein
VSNSSDAKEFFGYNNKQLNKKKTRDNNFISYVMLVYILDFA